MENSNNDSISDLMNGIKKKSDKILDEKVSIESEIHLLLIRNKIQFDRIKQCVYLIEQNNVELNKIVDTL